MVLKECSTLTYYTKRVLFKHQTHNGKLRLLNASTPTELNRSFSYHMGIFLDCYAFGLSYAWRFGYFR